VRDKLREGLTTLLHRLIRNKKLTRSRAASSEKIPPPGRQTRKENRRFPPNDSLVMK